MYNCYFKLICEDTSTTRNTGADILQDINYTYDAVGNIVEIVDNAQQTHYFNNTVIEPKGKYWYDALYRLVKATGREKDNLGAAPTNADLAATTPVPYTGAENFDNYTHYYAYDKLGNMQSMQSANKWTRYYVYYTNNLNRLLKHDDQQTLDDYTYDAHGNMLSMPGIQSMEWDFVNQLHRASVTDENSTKIAYYNYDAGSERARKVVEKTGQNIKEVRIYFSNFEVYRKYVKDVLETERTTLHISDGQRRIAFFESLTVEAGITLSTPQDTVRYQYDNNLGSSCLELDESANTISYEEYHPFGTSSYRLHRNNTETSLKRYRYVGKERDEETGLYYYGARYYAAHIARFVSVDPLQDDYPYLTPYNYAGNKPVTHIDIDGMQGTGDKKWNSINEVSGGEYFNGIQFYDEAKTYNNIPNSNFSIGGDSFMIGNYSMTPHYSKMEKGGNLLSYYSATYTGNEQKQIHYIVGPNQLDQFKKSNDTYAAAGLCYYMNGTPAEGMIRLAAGEYGKGLGMLWKEALNDPLFVATAALATVNMGVGALKPSLPQGVNQSQFNEISKTLKTNIKNNDDIFIHGSRAKGTAKPNSDIDIGIRVDNETFDNLIKERFNMPNPGSAKEKTMLHALETGKIQAGEAGFKNLKKAISQTLGGMKVDISYIRKGSQFDKGPYLKIK